MNEFEIRVLIAVSCTVIGGVIGFIIGRGRRTDDDKDRLTQLQLLSIPMFFGYLVLTSVSSINYSDLVATGILAITAGEWVGKAIAKRVDK